MESIILKKCFDSELRQVLLRLNNNLVKNREAQHYFNLVVEAICSSTNTSIIAMKGFAALEMIDEHYFKSICLDNEECFEDWKYLRDLELWNYISNFKIFKILQQHIIYEK